MTRKRTLSAALATTASVALLAGLSPAQAQMGGTPGGPCSTTVISPAKQDCTLPSSKAPGAGSFPGSILVPGTTTSFAVHGWIQVDVTHDLGPHVGDTGLNENSVPLNGTNAYAHNGGTNMNVKATRPNIQTSTPTAYGELKTYVEFDFNQTSTYQLAGNNDLLRLRQAYGTLGPWLIGQTYSLYADTASWGDTANGEQDAGYLRSDNIRRPEIRYTYLAGNGVSIAGAIDQPSYQGNVYSYATTGAAALTGASINGGYFESSTSTGAVAVTNLNYWNWPHLVAAAQWDQPWGHLRLTGAGGVYDVRGGSSYGLSTSTTPNRSFGGYAIQLSGHLNTWGKDALRGAVWYNSGAADFTSDSPQGGQIVNMTTGAVSTVKSWAGYANYEHFFNNIWRVNESFGYVHDSNGSSIGSGAVAYSGAEKTHFTNNANIIYSPVPQTDFIFEWQHYYRQVGSVNGATQDHGSTNQLDAQFKFYF